MDVVANYWNLNNIYIVITIIVLLLVSYMVWRLHTMLIMDLASQGSCDDPWALYLDDGTRTKCIAAKQRDDLIPHDVQFKTDAATIDQNIDALQKKMEQTDADYVALQKRLLEEHTLKLKNMKQAIVDLSGTIVNIKKQYTENKEALEKLVNDYDTAIQKNADLMVQLGNNLVDNLTKNIYTPNWSKQRAYMVNAYKKIVKYLKLNQNIDSSGSLLDNSGNIIGHINYLTPEAIKGKKL